MKHTLVNTAAALLLALALASCASVSVEEGASNATAQKPEVVYVMPFGTTRGEFNVGRDGAELIEFKHDLQAMMKAGITTDLTKRLVSATPGRQNDWTLHKNAWIITGEFVRVNQGSRLLRGAVGFGAGGTKLETQVQVYSLAENPGAPFLTFTTTGGSGAEPGAIMALTTDPLQLAIGAVSGVAHGLTEDTKRTSREITAELSDYMYKHGWITQDQWIKPKTVGGNAVF